LVNLSFTNQNCWPIGLDIGHNTINMVQLAGAGASMKVLAAEKTRIEAGIGDDVEARNNFIVSAVQKMLTKGKFSGRKVVAALTNEKLRITSLRLAQMDEQATKQALRKETAERFGFGSDEDSVDYLVVGQVNHGEEVKNELILFAASDQSIREHIALIEKTGLIPVGIDPIPYALFRSFTRSLRRHEDQEQTMVFIDIGSRYTTVVFGKAGQISFIKEIPIGGERFDKQISERLDISPEEAEVLRATLRVERSSKAFEKSTDSALSVATAVQQSIDVSTRQAVVDAVGAVAQELAREISLCFRYYTVTFRGKRVERSIFSGGGAYEDILLNVLKRQLTVEVEIAEPFRGFNMADVNFSNDKRASLCEWAVAVGLGLKAVPE
jgi:type IV pilus assembly protein PilM